MFWRPNFGAAVSSDALTEENSPLPPCIIDVPVTQWQTKQSFITCVSQSSYFFIDALIFSVSISIACISVFISFLVSPYVLQVYQRRNEWWLEEIFLHRSVLVRQVHMTRRKRIKTKVHEVKGVFTSLRNCTSASAHIGGSPNTKSSRSFQKPSSNPRTLLSRLRRPGYRNGKQMRQHLAAEYYQAPSQNVCSDVWLRNLWMGA